MLLRLLAEHHERVRTRMAEKDLEFLRALYAANTAIGGEPLLAERVNGLGDLLALSEEDVFHRVGRLQSEGLLRIQWGGKVIVTAKGEERVTGGTVATAPGSVTIRNIGAGANVAIGQDAVAGAGAVGAGAVRIEVARGDLAAALQALGLAEGELPAEAKTSARELKAELERMLEETRRAQPDMPKLEQNLQRAEGLLGTINNISNAAVSLFSQEGLIGIALGHLRRWITPEL